MVAIALAGCGSEAATDRPAVSDRTEAPTPTGITTTATTERSPASTSGPTSSSTTVRPGAEGPAPDAVTLACDGTGATLSSPSVRTQPDGIHIAVDNRSGEELSLTFVDRGEVVAPGFTATVQTMAPGDLAVSCGYDLNRRIVPAGALRVTDPDENWIATDVDCTRLPLTRWEGPLPAAQPTPEAAVRWWVANRPGDLVGPVTAADEVRLVGYPQAANPIYVLRHDGRDTDVFQVRPDADGWTAGPHERCPG